LAFHEKAISLYRNAYKCILNKENKLNIKTEINKIAKNTIHEYEPKNLIKFKGSQMQLKRRSLSESSISLMSNDQKNTGSNLRNSKQIRATKFYSKDSNYGSSSSSITCNNNNIHNILLRKQANSLKFDQCLDLSDDDDVEKFLNSLA